MEKEESSESLGKINLKYIRKNVWAISTIVLAVVLIIALVLKSGCSGAVSENEAAESLIEFINSQGGATAELVSVEKDGALYNVVVSYNGEEIPVSVTLDGEFIVSKIVPLTGNSIDSSDSSDSEGQEVAQDVPKLSTPKVELFVMSHCPYGTQAEKGIIPVVELLGDKIDFELKFVYYAMHGKTEVDEQTRQYCIQKNQNAKFLPYLKCFLKAGDSAACLDEAAIDTAKVDSCVKTIDVEYSITKNFEDKDSWLSGQFPLFDIYKVDNSKYDIAGSPTLVVNGQVVSSGRDSASLLNTICSSFTDAPAECDESLSSTSPSAGFGYGTSSGSTDAQCG